MSVRELLLPAAETFLKTFLKTSARSRDNTGEAERERKGPIPNRSVSPRG